MREFKSLLNHDTIRTIEDYAAKKKMSVNDGAALIKRTLGILIDSLDIKQEKRNLTEKYRQELKLLDNKLLNLSEDCRHEFVTNWNDTGMIICSICEKEFIEEK